MSELSRRTLFWSPRVLSIAFIGFLSILALDVLDRHLGVRMTLVAATKVQ